MIIGVSIGLGLYCFHRLVRSVAATVATHPSLRSGVADQAIVDSYDPLREQFDALERDIAARERQRAHAEIVANCSHYDTVKLWALGEPTVTLCRRCGKVLIPQH